MSVIDDLKEAFKKYSKGPKDLENDTGIKASRVYKWLQGISNPKSDDTELLKSWLEKVRTKDGKLEIVRIEKIASENKREVESQDLSEINAKYIALLEKNLREKEQEINKLQELIKEVQGSLSEWTRNFATSHAMNEAFHEEILELLIPKQGQVKQLNQDEAKLKKSLLVSIRNSGFEKMLDYEKKGIYVDMSNHGK